MVVKSNLISIYICSHILTIFGALMTSLVVVLEVDIAVFDLQSIDFPELGWFAFVSIFSIFMHEFNLKFKQCKK